MIYFRKRDGRIYKNEFKMGCNKLLYMKNVRIRNFSLSICFLVFVQEISEGWEHNEPRYLGTYYAVLHCCNTIFFLISYDAKFKSIAILDMKFRFTCGEWKLCEFCKILKYFEKDCIVCVQRSMAELLIAPDSIHKNS